MASVATADVSVTAAAAAAIGMPTASSKVLYIGGLDEAVTPALLQAAFVPFGDLVAVDVPLHAATQKARGFGFVEFGDEADARDAMLNMDGAELYGRVLRVRPAEGGRRLGGNKAVWAAADDLSGGGDATTSTTVAVQTTSAPFQVLGAPSDFTVTETGVGFEFTWAAARPGLKVQLHRVGTDDTVIAETSPFVWALEPLEGGSCFEARTVDADETRLGQALAGPECVAG